MQTTQTNRGLETESGFPSIPTRIREIPPLIVGQEQRDATREQVVPCLIELSARLAQVHRAAAEAYLSQCMYAEALPHCEAAATFAPDELEYHNQLGFVRYIQGDDEGAVQSFAKVLAVQPSHPDALFNLGMIQFGRQDFAAAEDCFRRSLESRPGDAETWNNRGVCLHQLGHRDDASTCFDRALQLDPGNQDAQANRAALHG